MESVINLLRQDFVCSELDVNQNHKEDRVRGDALEQAPMGGLAIGKDRSRFSPGIGLGLEPLEALASAAAFDPALTVDPAALYIGVGPETLRQLARDRKIACIRAIGKRSTMRFRMSDLNAFLAKNVIRPLRQSVNG